METVVNTDTTIFVVIGLIDYSRSTPLRAFRSLDQAQTFLDLCKKHRALTPDWAFDGREEVFAEFEKLEKAHEATRPDGVNTDFDDFGISEIQLAG